ncbi:MAG: SDR family NAD(P)-dependent oxidoreductase [Chromatiales bacterium]|jgi:NAD(P)-dependent dehydrogenase (short-subunit alcohol dehydrogenase family)
MRGKIALVTGASRGFGFASAAAFGAAGAHVLALARTVGGLEELDDRIKAAGGEATLIPLDICDDPGLARMGAAIYERWGRIDLWLHTALHTPPLQPVEHIDAMELDRSLATNLRAFQRLIRVIDPLLRQAEAPVALIAADDRTGAKFHGTYAAAKAAQSAFTRAWAAESGARIAIAEVVPPPMPTAMRARFHPGEDRAALTPAEDVAARLMARLATGGIGSGERISL